ncbi:MAG: divalent metal cation transporter [Solirubrobacteraceae bacterium]|nr:divalent metal cation transporter [Solirubrobacteraceae bacterium]
MPHRPHPSRHLHRRVTRRRAHHARKGGIAALVAVVGPGLLAGLSDDDPPGITTYSLLGAEHGTQLLWVLLLSTAALIVFHELGARMGVVTGKGLLAVIREHAGPRRAAAVIAVLLIANTGTMCAELAGVAAGADLLFGTPAWVSVPLAVLAVAALVLRGSFHRIEHVLLLLSSVFAAYIASGLLAGPDWGEAARGTFSPSMPLDRDTILLVVATIGTTLAPWGLAFIQSYAADKRIPTDEIGLERVDVITGAALTGVIGAFIVMSCAATLHASGQSIDDVADAARGLEPVAGSAAADLFAAGFLGAALLAAAVVPLSTAYSVAEGRGQVATIGHSFAEAPAFHATFAAVLGVATLFVLVPGMPLLEVLYLSQALNAVLLLGILPLMLRLGRDPAVMGGHATGRIGQAAGLLALALVTTAILALLVLQAAG